MKPVSRYHEIGIFKEPLLFFKNQNLAILNPNSIIKILGLNLIFKKKESDKLKVYLSYESFETLGDFLDDTLNMRVLGRELGRCYEPLPLCAAILKSWVKAALFISYKLRKTLLSYRKMVLDFVASGCPRKWKDTKKEDCNITFPEPQNIPGENIESKLRYCKKKFPILDWDLRFFEILVKVKKIHYFQKI